MQISFEDIKEPGQYAHCSKAGDKFKAILQQMKFGEEEKFQQGLNEFKKELTAAKFEMTCGLDMFLKDLS